MMMARPWRFFESLYQSSKNQTTFFCYRYWALLLCNDDEEEKAMAMLVQTERANDPTEIEVICVESWIFLFSEDDDDEAKSMAIL